MFDNENLEIMDLGGEGISIQYLYYPPDREDFIQYFTSLSKKSLKQVAKGLKKNRLDWTIDDNSISILGSKEEIILIFRDWSPPGVFYGDVEVRLSRDDSKRFVDEILNY